jgi:hypothetical protein
MRIRLGILVAAAYVLAFSVTTGAEPAVKPPAIFSVSTHARLACVDCHADLAAVAEFPHPDKLATVNCASCHDAEGTTCHDRPDVAVWSARPG